ncbi:hypothetical protein [uncultured Actinomyces sp.]|uniref:vWA domain-containing protein n=1 Tax=uncultured Actinomyces sp. TaxID=249061 RepID=UPI00260C63D0|nr:hypothetical protein [uncultured Actinomyces sp.]
MPSTVTYRDASPLLPIYLICDTSGSMDYPERGMSPKPIDVLNDSIINLFHTVYYDLPRTTTDIHISIISFNDRAVLNRAMDAVDSGATFTPLKASGLTTLSAGLEMFERRLDIDERERYPRRSFRPVAFVLTDGKPTDSEEEWGRVIDRLGSRPFPPRIIPCTLGKPEPAVLERLTKAYSADTGVLVKDILIDGRDVAQRISSLFNRISKTLNEIQIPADMTTHDTRDQITIMDATIAEALTSARNTTTVSFDDILSGYR